MTWKACGFPCESCTPSEWIAACAAMTTGTRHPAPGPVTPRPAPSPRARPRHPAPGPVTPRPAPSPRGSTAGSRAATNSPWMPRSSRGMTGTACYPSSPRPWAGAHCAAVAEVTRKARGFPCESCTSFEWIAACAAMTAGTRHAASGHIIPAPRYVIPTLIAPCLHPSCHPRASRPRPGGDLAMPASYLENRRRAARPNNREELT